MFFGRVLFFRDVRTNSISFTWVGKNIFILFGGVNNYLTIPFSTQYKNFLAAGSKLIWASPEIFLDLDLLI